MGPVGAGKTEAVRTLSDIEVVSTDVDATDETAALKDKTTVAMDVGVMDLGDGDKLRLYGAPGQDRFDFMWDILLEQTKGIVLLLNHSNPQPLHDLNHFVGRLSASLAGRKLPLVIGVTHIDKAPHLPLRIYADQLEKNPIPFAICRVPIFFMDARVRREVRTAVIALAAILEMAARFPEKKAAE